MGPTTIMPLIKKIYPKISGFLNFRWFFASILLGLITSWLIKDSITPLLLWGKSFSERSLLYQVLILVIYVFFTSTVFFCTLIIARLLLIKWSKAPSYHRASRELRDFIRYSSVKSRISDIKKGETLPNTKQSIHSGNPPVFSGEKEGSLNLVDWLRSYWGYVVIYVFFLYVSSTTARVGDDWEISQWYQNGFLSTLAGMMRATTYLNGRVASLFLARSLRTMMFYGVLQPPLFSQA